MPPAERRCPVCGNAMVSVRDDTTGSQTWKRWHCNFCQHEELVRVIREGGVVRHAWDRRQRV